MRMHILQSSGLNLYTVIVHAPTPAGNNSAGVAWSTAIQNAGLAGTQMTVGNGAGQITSNESNQVSAGTVIEASLPWEDNPAWDAATRLADLNARAAIAVNSAIADLSARLKWFGQTVA